ncbi:hypothetical protein V6N11_008681 [Hibiscus sabdariffa]|uniref:Uncharacterized protein n=1 Tax=Hibiscus sabdariffa TaxID=183260 RepID=A0ABR2PPG4_9ROSI
MASPPSKQIQCSRKVTVQVSGNVIAEKQPCEDACPPDNQTIGHGETVKLMVYHHQRRRCGTPMLAGKGMADVQLRKLVVE